jgi:hypothetical protein
MWNDRRSSDEYGKNKDAGLFSCGALQSQHGAIGEPSITKPDLPEVGVFTISLETPPKDADHDDSWPLQRSIDNVHSSVVSRGGYQDEVKFRFVTKGPVSVPQEGKVTPASSGSNKMDKYEQLKAPKKHNNRGRAEQLTRYIHKYDCEDFMEYAVDIHHWKVSLEEAFTPGDWTLVQYDISPGMRLTLLEWLVTVTRTLEFSLETWCLAVNYIDRFLCTQLVGRDTLQLLGLTALWLAAKQEELLPPGLDQLVTLAAETYTEINFRHMELLILAKLELRLAAPTPAYLLNHLIAVEEERDWSEDLSRHMVEIVLEDHVLARQRPSRIAHAVYEAIKSLDFCAVQILENSCPKCEPHNADMWCEELFQMCLQRVIEALTMSPY